MQLLVGGTDNLIGDSLGEGDDGSSLCNKARVSSARRRREETRTDHVQMPRNVRSGTNEQQEGKVHRTPNHRDKLIPSQQDENAVHPNGNLADRADHTPLGLEVVSIGFTTETRGKVVGFGVGEDDQGRREVEFAFLGGGGVDRGGGGEGEGVGRVGRSDTGVEWDESEDLLF